LSTREQKGGIGGKLGRRGLKDQAGNVTGVTRLMRTNPEKTKSIWRGVRSQRHRWTKETAVELVEQCCVNDPAQKARTARKNGGGGGVGEKSVGEMACTSRGWRRKWGE